MGDVPALLFAVRVYRSSWWSDRRPIIIWQIKKTELPAIDVHGKNALNWILSFLLYTVASFLLAFVLIGIPILLALGICGIVFPILAGVKANNGQVWKYPMAIPFIN